MSVIASMAAASVLNEEVRRLRAELEIANQKREFAEFEWDRATEHAQKRDRENERMKKALEEIMDQAATKFNGGAWASGIAAIQLACLAQNREP